MPDITVNLEGTPVVIQLGENTSLAINSAAAAAASASEAAASAAAALAVADNTMLHVRARGDARTRGQQVGQWASWMATMAAQNCERWASLATGTTWYVDPAAVGGLQDGTSYADAFLTKSAAYAVAQPGDTVRVRTSDPVNYPLRPEAPINRRSGIHEIMEDAFVSGAYSFTDVQDHGGNTFSGVAATQVDWFAYDFKQDDITGTVTGVDVTVRSDILLQAVRMGRPLTDFAAWYGFFRAAASETTTPAVGEYCNHSNGRTYFTLDTTVHGSPSAATVAGLAIYNTMSASVNTYRALGSTTISGRISGSATYYFLPGASDGLNIPIRFLEADHFAVDGKFGMIAHGYHAISMAGSSRTNLLIKGMLATGGFGGSPTVFRNGSENLPYPDNQVDACAFMSQPYLDWQGKPLLGTYTGSGQISLSHGAGGVGTNQYGGFLLSNSLVLDPSQMLKTKHALSYALSVFSFAMAQHPGPYDPDDPNAYPIQVVNCVGIGPCCGPEHDGHYLGFKADCMNVEQTGKSWNTPTGNKWIFLEDSLLRMKGTGTTGIPFNQLQDGRGGIKFRGTTAVLLLSAGTQGLIQLTNPPQPGSIDTSGLQFDHATPGGAFITCAGTVSKATFLDTDPVKSRGGNALGANVTSPVRLANGNQMLSLAEWRAEVDPNGRDLDSVDLSLALDFA